MELLAKFDKGTEVHINNFRSKQSSFHYFSHGIQNELISLMAKNIKNHIVGLVKKTNTIPLYLTVRPI